MQYALLIYEDEHAGGKEAGGPVFMDVIAKHRALTGQLADEGVRRGGSGLKSTSSATTLRTTAGRQAIHDGPFAETREQLGGFYLIEAADLDAALAVARRIPLMGDGAVEVRPVLGPG